jgi:hypothetical protein
MDKRPEYSVQWTFLDFHRRAVSVGEQAGQLSDDSRRTRVQVNRNLVWAQIGVFMFKYCRRHILSSGKIFENRTMDKFRILRLHAAPAPTVRKDKESRYNREVNECRLYVFRLSHSFCRFSRQQHDQKKIACDII